MRNEREVCPVGCLHKHSQAYEEAKHCGFGFGIQYTDRDQVSTSCHAEEYKPYLLCPDGLGSIEDEIGYDSTHGPEYNVKKPKHGCPFSCFRLIKVGKVHF